MTRRPVLWMMVASLVGPASWARAQGCIPNTVVQATVIGSAESAQIDGCIKDPLTALSSDDATEVRQAREVLLAPFREPRVSVPFRQIYSDKLMPTMRRLTTGQARDYVAANALRVAGELGTPDAAALLKDVLSDSRDPIRVFAAAEVKRVFDLLVLPNQPAIGVGDLLALVDRLGDGLVKESQPNVVDAVVRALMAGAVVERPGFDLVRRKAYATLCTKGSALALKLPAGPGAEPFLSAILRAQASVRDAISLVNPKLDLNKAEVLQGVEFQARALEWVAVNHKTLPQGRRDIAVAQVRLAETAISVGLSKADGQWNPTRMAEDLDKGTPQGDRDFLEKAVRLLQYLETEHKLGPFMKK